MKNANVKRASRLHRYLYRATRGVVGRRLVDNDMLLLTTTGRKTGINHSVPLLYLTDDDGSHVVIASYGGRPYHPDWYLNLVDEPQVEVQIRGARFAANAYTLRPAEREEWWPRVVAAYDGYAAYDTRSAREIPIVSLERVQDEEISNGRRR